MSALDDELPVDLSARRKNVSVQTEKMLPDITSDRMKDALFNLMLDVLNNRTDIEKNLKKITTFYNLLKKSQECSVPLSIPIQAEDWSIPQPESLPNTYQQHTDTTTVPNLAGLEGIGINLNTENSIFLNEYVPNDNVIRHFDSEDVSPRGPTVSSLVNIGTVNSETLNSKLSSVSFDAESTGSQSDTSGGGGNSGGGRKSRDEKIIFEMGIPFSSDRIINCSMDDFNSMLVSSGMTEEQINTCRDIRRRGKNKIAAQNCRKRKVDQITILAEEVGAVREKKQRILTEHAALEQSLEDWKVKLFRLETYILSHLGRDQSTWSLEFIGDTDQITLVPKGRDWRS